MTTWEQQFHNNEFVFAAEPFLRSKARWWNKTIYREMPWTNNAGQLWHTSKPLKTHKLSHPAYTHITPCLVLRGMQTSIPSDMHYFCSHGEPK